MNNYFQYSIHAELPVQAAKAAELGVKFVTTLDALHLIDSAIFDDWQIVDLPATESFPLAGARPRIAAIIESNVKRGDWEDPEPGLGYNVVAFTGEGSGPRTIGLDVVSGGMVKGSASLQTGAIRCLLIQRS
jgi:hypothetical protein